MTLTRKIYIVIVNWNGWKDTIECLESVFRLHHDNFTVIVCDNDSKDGSMERIIEWTKGAWTGLSASPEMRCYTEPPVSKPISWVSLKASQSNDSQFAQDGASLMLIRSEKNLGFAGGNNLGLRYILKRDDHDFVWLLNNDTVVHPEALTELINRMKEDPRIGICGSKLRFYSAPDVIQAYGGGTYNLRTARNRHIGEFNPVSVVEDRAKVEHQLGYVVGASMFISKDFLDAVGLMNEDYFLYYEEIDWATRAKGKFLQGYAPGSIVFHKQGKSGGGKRLSHRNEAEEEFLLSDFYSVRNQIRFSRTYYPQYLPVVATTVAWRLLKRIVAGKRKRVWSVIRGVSAGFSGELLEREF